MTAVQAWALILGAITPFLVAVINQPTWSMMTRRVVGVAVALLVGLVNIVVQGMLDNFQPSLTNVLVALAAVVGASQTFWAVVWKPTGVTDTLEAKTSKDDSVPPQG